MHLSHEEFLQSVSGFLGMFYLALGLMNGVAAYYLWQLAEAQHHHAPTAEHPQDSHLGNKSFGCLFLAVVFSIMSPLAFSGSATMMAPISLPQFMVDGVNYLFAGSLGPVLYSTLSVGLLAVLFLGRRFFVRPVVAWIVWNCMLVLLAVCMTNPNFASIVMKPDNVPIVAMVYLLAFFTWLATAQAVKNDDRAKDGLPPLEKLDDEKILVWPDLVYTELICMVAITAVLILWAVVLKAPLEEPADAAKTPNPSKAPWYFLGLQEMLVYYDPWFAGVVAPLVIVGGLMAIPYLDFNKLGNGYYTIDQRKFAYVTFQFGFLVLWVTFIILGTFLRGPNWNFFGPFEQWDVHKVVPLNNVDLSEFFWVQWLGMPKPKAPPDVGAGAALGFAIWRELPGILLLLGYFTLLPPILATTVFRKFFQKMGLIRFMILASLLLLMALFPIKMVLRWSFNLKYIIALPEYLANF
ncbi:hypothetical protein [Blastopirellula marina]|uniref:Cytochrome b/b6 C-terminal region profile domain-containing protein n=1 Tax=Blastopirellula marina DSM 3645 TaxID=314230 RepID=A3ZT64_9BACT|nr:hypothetical protein [Blastopirellula marina]EAQ80216.1 hypothetical protein DSM3645_19508 [Blastopirellula marina DSM 3645]